MNLLSIRLSAGKIRRYHTAILVGEQTVGDHTYGVLQILREITGDNCSSQLMKAALDHDIMEFYTGDVPYPAKKQFRALGEILERLDEALLEEHALIYSLTEKEKVELRAADMLEAAYFGLYQMALGNQYGRAIAEEVFQAFDKLPSVDVPQRAKELIIELRGENVSK